MQNPDHKIEDLGRIEPTSKTETLRELEENKKISRKRKLLIALLIIGLVVILGGAAFGGYFFGSKKNPPQGPAETKKEEENATYKNTRFGYQFEYPKSWQTDGDEMSKKLSLLPTQSQEGQKKEITINAYNNDGSSSSTFIKKNLGASDYKEGSLEDINYLTKGTMIEGYQDAYKTAFFANTNFVIEISANISSDDQVSYAVFEQVIKSFKFGESQEVSEKTYTIQPGDTLFSISQKFGVGMDTLASYNGIENPDQIKYGMVIKIPSSTQEATEKKFNINLEQMKKYQADADAGRGSSRLDPVAVAKEEAKGVFGITESFNFELVSVDKNKGEAVVSASSGDKKYQIILTQPVKIGEGGIWAVSSVKKEA